MGLYFCAFMEKCHSFTLYSRKCEKKKFIKGVLWLVLHFPNIENPY